MTTHKPYLEMQKEFYERDIPPEEVVGYYDVHETYPYETFLLYKNADVRYPLVEDSKSKIALDFGCGPGRMVARMSKLFARADGVDISQRLLDVAAQKNPTSKFYVTGGDDLGETPKNHYDFVYSTLCLQHIAVHSVRMNILKNISQVMKPGAVTTLQFNYNPDFPYVLLRKSLTLGSRKVFVFNEDTRHARWRENRVEAEATNSACDVGIGAEDLEVVVEDFSKYFSNVTYWFYQGAPAPRDVNLAYWPTQLIFINGYKIAE